MDKLNRIPSLDGLRTVSIGFVLLAHFLHSMGVVDFFNLGNLGVRIFFVISGFLITGLLLKELERTDSINLTKFYFRRTMRIFPPYYFFLAVLLVTTLMGYLQIPQTSFSMAFAYVTNYYNPDTWNLGHTRSLSVEEQFYLLFPDTLLLFGLRRTKFLLVAIVLASPFIRFADYSAFGESRWFGMGFHYNMDALGLGCLLSLFQSRLHQNSSYKRLMSSKIFYLLPLVVLFANLFPDRPRISAFASSIMNLLIAVCIDWTVTNYQSLPGRILNCAPMVYLGTMSYSVYLWQQVFFDNSGATWTKFPINIVGLALMSLCSYYLVEKSALILKRGLETKLFDPASELKATTSVNIA